MAGTQETDAVPSAQGQQLPLFQRFAVGRIVIIVLVVATIVILLRALLTPSGAATNTTNKLGTPGAAAPLVGHYAPNVTLLDLHNNRVALSSWHGKVVVLNFWYVACEPCRYEMPALQQTYDAQASRGFAVLGINAADDVTSITQFVRGLGITYPVLRDVGQRATIQYRVVDTPTSFIIDRQGVIRYKMAGPLDKTTLNQDIAALLAEPS